MVQYSRQNVDTKMLTVEFTCAVCFFNNILIIQTENYVLKFKGNQAEKMVISQDNLESSYIKRKYTKIVLQKM